MRTGGSPAAWFVSFLAITLVVPQKDFQKSCHSFSPDIFLGSLRSTLGCRSLAGSLLRIFAGLVAHTCGSGQKMGEPQKWVALVTGKA